MKTRNESIEGVIVPISWNERGKVKGVSLYTSGDEDVVLVHHYSPFFIKSLINKRVKVFGKTIGVVDGCRVFSVKRLLKKERDFFKDSRDSMTNHEAA